MKKSDYLNLFVSGMLFESMMWDFGNNNISGAFFNLFLSAILFLLFVKDFRRNKKREFVIGDLVCYKEDLENPFPVIGLRANMVEIQGDFSAYESELVWGRKWVPKEHMVKWRNKPKK